MAIIRDTAEAEKETPKTEPEVNSFEEIEKTKAKLFHSKKEAFRIFGINQHFGLFISFGFLFSFMAFLPFMRSVKDAQAVVIPQNIVDMEALKEGHIHQIHVKAGDFVEKGEKLIEIINPSDALEIEKTKASLKMTRAKLRDMGVKRLYWFERFVTDKRLLNQEVISEDEFLKTELTFKTLEEKRNSLFARAVSLKETITFLEQERDSGTLYAPFSGMVISNPQVKLGTFTEKGEFLLSLASRDQRIEFRLKQADYGRIEKGQLALIRFYSIPGKLFRGEVLEIQHYAEPVEKNGFKTNAIKVLIKVPDFPEGVRNGMFANVRIEGRPVSLIEFIKRRI